MDKKISSSETIKALVKTAVESYAVGFKGRHEGEVDNPDGTLNMKIHNVFIAALGPEIQYFTALVRSLDSSLGNMLEKLAISIAELFYEVDRKVEGPLTVNQTRAIAELLEKYKSHERKPSVGDYKVLREKPQEKILVTKRHDSDYYLIDKETGHHYLIELKIGGDLDNKKARSEKEAILEQFAILSNTLDKNTEITIHFATAYNRFGEDKEWQQERVKQFFAKEELLIGRDFWNFICKSDEGYNLVLGAYKENAYLIKNVLGEIKKLYLKQ
ncbi:TdeIII family type II restriction endonuclease [Patescibacteria group bacterium]|nr:TdeIII family type II restriction endonuclease [Patescibacteria group bacterium]MCL5797773.1 TdeIII family type II restriction endonuclease [Patescibacteria group bacterium]